MYDVMYVSVSTVIDTVANIVRCFAVAMHTVLCSEGARISGMCPWQSQSLFLDELHGPGYHVLLLLSETCAAGTECAQGLWSMQCARAKEHH